jgi:hypothetical protein
MLTSHELDKLLPALSSRLEVLGFDKMAEDVLKEKSLEKLKPYVSVIVNNAPAGRREYVADLFNKINLL